jgi:hypothetical protein
VTDGVKKALADLMRAAAPLKLRRAAGRRLVFCVFRLRLAALRV